MCIVADWRWTKGAIKQAVQVAFRSWKSQGNWAPRQPPDGNRAHLHFSLRVPHQTAADLWDEKVCSFKPLSCGCLFWQRLELTQMDIWRAMGRLLGSYSVVPGLRRAGWVNPGQQNCQLDTLVISDNCRIQPARMFGRWEQVDSWTASVSGKHLSLFSCNTGCVLYIFTILRSVLLSDESGKPSDSWKKSELSNWAISSVVWWLCEIWYYILSIKIWGEKRFRDILAL